MNNDLFEKGLEKRKATLGKEYVENNLANADEFTLPFQEAMTAWCWGFGWGLRIAFPPNVRNSNEAAGSLIDGFEGGRHPPVRANVWNAFLVVVAWWRELDIFGRYRGPREVLQPPDYQRFFGTEPGDV